MRKVTAGLSASKTSPTLVDFQNKNAKLPDWRIQLQNAVQQRKGGSGTSTPAPVESPVFASHGSAAIKALDKTDNIESALKTFLQSVK